MANSESSDEGSGAASTFNPGNAASLKHWQRWRPGWYFAVFLVNATATAVLFPVQYKRDVDDMLLQHYRLCFSGMMLASLGCGCVAAFLIKRARASAHVGLASGYAIINWFQSILASMSLNLHYAGFAYGLTGLMPMMCNCIGGGFPFILVASTACRSLLYLIASFFMQKLIASRLDLLEQSSNQKYGSSSVYTLLRAQACGAFLTAFFVCGWGVSYAFDVFIDIDIGLFMLFFAVFLGALTVFLNVVANMLAACSLTKSFLELRRVLHVAELKDASVAARASLRRARRFAALQMTGVSFSLVLTILVIPFVVLGMGFSSASQDQELSNFQAACVVIQAIDVLGNAVAVLILSGSHRLKKAGQAPYQGCQSLPCKQTRPPQIKETDWCPAWKDKVEELSVRGMTLRSLLHFYQANLPSIPDWRYAPQDHKTRDVVRRVIIPLTSREECSYATSSLNRDGSQRAQIMVTHNWGNSFNDLLAAVVSDALRECSFRMVAQLLEEDCFFLSEILGKSSRLDDTYWICAFAVNQHSSICHSNPYDRDPFTHELHPVCTCSCVNISDPDGRSTSSEINKFDDMMHHLATTGICRQVIAVDKSLELFHRAWCVAEIAEAKRLDMTQSLQLLSKATMQQRARTLENLDVRSMQASSEKDKELILGKIEDVEEFNAELQALIFDPKSGLVASWNAMDSLQQVGEVGRLIRWGLADAGTGKVWKAWEAHE